MSRRSVPPAGYRPTGPAPASIGKALGLHALPPRTAAKVASKPSKGKRRGKASKPPTLAPRFTPQADHPDPLLDFAGCLQAFLAAHRPTLSAQGGEGVAVLALLGEAYERAKGAVFDPAPRRDLPAFALALAAFVDDWRPHAAATSEARALLGGLDAVLERVRSWSETDGSTMRAVNSDGVGGLAVELPAPALPDPEAVLRGARAEGQRAAREAAAERAGLDETMGEIGDGLLSSYEHLRELQDALGMARHYLRFTLGECARAKQDPPSGLRDIEQALDEADDCAWQALNVMTPAMAIVVGAPRNAPSPTIQAARLAALLPHLGGRVLEHSVDVPEARASWTRRRT